ncbi:DUF2510 domain-containing protein [Leucobacter luti]|uniref:DUF2510 domain-containing protein n=1 Tax=Leucobacter luti TaxID=340320 RepID=UPI003CFBE8EA
MNSVQPGWYPDQTGTLRWWDGQQWTEHTQAAPDQPQYVEQPGEAALEPSPSSGRLRHIGAAIAIAAVVGLGVVVAGAALVMSLAGPQAPAEASSKTGSSQEGADGKAGGDAENPPPLVPHEPVSAEQQKVLEETVAKYNSAFETQDCALYTETTSSTFRENNGECTSKEYFAGMEISDHKSKTIRATEVSDAVAPLYELRVDETFMLNGEPFEARHAYVLTDDPDTGKPIIEILIDRN